MLCEKFKDLAIGIINYEEKEIIPLTDEETKSYEEEKVCHICREQFCTNENEKNKVRDHCHYAGKSIGAAHSICNLRCKVPKEIPVLIYNGSTYDYHFIIK